MTATRFEVGHGATLRCRGWRQEGILRMLENTVVNADRPGDLNVHGRSGAAVRDWPSLHAIIETLHCLADDETLVVQSGRPVAVFRTFEQAPRVLIANANPVPPTATAERFGELRGDGLTMHGQYTADSWAYVGGQGIVQGTYETFGACARQNFGGSLAGRVVLTAGLGGMGHAQAPAVSMAGGVALISDADPAKLERWTRYIDMVATDLDEAWKLCRGAAERREARVVALVANAADAAEKLLERGALPDIATDQTSAHDLVNGYVPSGLDVAAAGELRARDPEEYRRRVEDTVARHARALLRMRERGVVVFEYGNDLRRAAVDAGVADAASIPSFVLEYVRPSFAVGRGPFRWVCLSGEVTDECVLDAAARRLFRDDELLQRWLIQAAQRLPYEGLPARVCWLGHGARARMAHEINRLVRGGVLMAPVAVTRDHLDTGECCRPAPETEATPDDSDEIADWPYLNAMLNVAAGADLVAVHQNAGATGGCCSAGMTVICDGSKLADERIARCLEADLGLNVVRHAAASVPEAVAYLPRTRIRVPVVAPSTPVPKAG